MLHDRHELHRVVSGLLDARQHLVAELHVRMDPLLLASHADVGLVDERTARRLRRFVPPLVLRLVHLRAEELRLRILHHVARVRRDALAASAGPAHLEPIVVSGLYRLRGQLQLPDVRAGDAHALVQAVRAPLREVSDEPHRGGVRGPLAEDPPAARPVESVVFVRRGPVGEGRLPSRKLVCAGVCVHRPSAYRLLERPQVFVVEQLCHLHLPGRVGRNAHILPKPRAAAQLPQHLPDTANWLYKRSSPFSIPESLWVRHPNPQLSP